MRLRSGIPLLHEVEQLLASDEYRRQVEFNRNFLQQHDAAMERYGRLWAKDTFTLWSRRWEYPFAIGRVIAFAESQPDRPMHILDAGSGVTFFPWYLCEELPRAQVTCFDSNASYHEMFATVNAQTPGSRVRFVEGRLQQIPLPDHSIDAVCCISVLEHTQDHERILDEFARVLRPGGALVLTFDLSLDGQFELSREAAKALLSAATQRFDVADDLDVLQELSRIDNQRDRILSTDSVKQKNPELLPWKYPALKAVHDLFKGHGWTGGFRSKSIYCLEFRARPTEVGAVHS